MSKVSLIATAARRCYGCYVWITLLCIVLPMCLLLAVTPGVRRRRRIARGAARLFFFAIGSPVRVEGEPLQDHHACVVVANHASYLDGIVLTAALPPSFTYLIKHEMATFPIAGFVLRRLGSAFVNRADHRNRQRITRELLERAMQGDALGFFPEGTFAETPGLQPFQLGAFGAAARASLPVVPVVIHGTRRKLPAGRVLPAPGPLSVRICPPVDAAQHPSARQLMQATRVALLEHLDEPDLAPAEAPAADGHIPE